MSGRNLIGIFDSKIPDQDGMIISTRGNLIGMVHGRKSWIVKFIKGNLIGMVG